MSSSSNTAAIDWQQEDIHLNQVIFVTGDQKHPSQNLHGSGSYDDDSFRPEVPNLSPFITPQKKEVLLLVKNPETCDQGALREFFPLLLKFLALGLTVLIFLFIIPFFLSSLLACSLIFFSPPS